jgi:hypothetical protein
LQNKMSRKCLASPAARKAKRIWPGHCHHSKDLTVRAMPAVSSKDAPLCQATWQGFDSHFLD